MIDGILTFVYILGVITCLYPFSRLVLSTVLGGPPYDDFDKGMSVFFGGLGSIFWPVVLWMIISWRVSKKIWMRVVGEELDEKARSSKRNY